KKLSLVFEGNQLSVLDNKLECLDKVKTSGSASSITPPTPIATPTLTTTVMAAPRLSGAAKGKQPARETTPTEPTDVERIEAEQLKIGDDEATESDRESEDEETREHEEESFYPIPRTPKDNEDDDNNEEDQGLRIGRTFTTFFPVRKKLSLVFERNQLSVVDNKQECLDKVKSVIYQSHDVLMIEKEGFESIIPSFGGLFKTTKSLFEFEYNIRIKSLLSEVPVSIVIPKTSVTIPNQVQPIFTKPKSTIRRYITRSPSPKTSNSPPRVTAVKALVDKGVIDSGCSQHMTGNMSYLSDFEELNGGYVAFEGSLGCFFLATKDETSHILKTFITGLENQLSLKVKVIKSDNGTEFKNNDLNQFCGMKGIKRKFSVPRTPQQNGIAERKNKTLIEATKTILADSLLPILFWAEAVNTACCVQNKVLVTKPYNKTPYEILHGRTPSISFIRPFGYPLTMLNTLDSLGKFDGKFDEGFLVRYSELDFDAKKPESELNDSPSSSAQSRKQDDNVENY
nr:ribonuclease H-like domain-containing protein [Tanacetum cinerariifolium]